MKQILLPVADEPTVTIAFSFAVGSQNDPPGKEGLAALTADMLVQGATKRFRYEEILAQLYPLATDYDAIIDRELTTIDGRVHRDKLDEFCELLTDAVLRPAFSPEDFARLKSDAVNLIENSLRYSSDEELAKAVLMDLTFERTRYAHPVAGTVSGIASITLDDVKKFYAAHFSRDALTIGIAGDYPEELAGKITAACRTLPSGTASQPPPITQTPPTGRRVVLIDKAGADASISFGFPLRVLRGTRDYYALWLANSWLGEHRHGASRLFQVIREQRGLNYGDYSYIEAFPDGGELQMPPVNVPRENQLFEVWIRTLPNEQAVFALKAALRELDRVIENGLTTEQFELTRSFLKKYSTHYAPTTSARLGYKIDDAFYGIEPEGHLERFRRVMDELTQPEVNAAVKEHWQTESLIIAIVTGEPTIVSNSLLSSAPTTIQYPNPMPAEILREDQSIASYPLNIADSAIAIRSVAECFA